MFRDGPGIDETIFDFDWGQPELATQRREHLLNAWTMWKIEGDQIGSQEEFLEADRILTEILDNNGVHPFTAARIKYSMTFFEGQYLQRWLDDSVSMDGK
jgi:hypothetical protein